MDYSSAFAISAAGMSVERTRVEVAALNLANANTVASSDADVFRPLRVIARPSFADTVSQGMRGVLPQASVQAIEGPPRMKYEPNHPLADEQGFVRHAPVDTAVEMVSLMSATRAYEANVAAMNTARQLTLKALEIGGNT